MFHFVNIVSAQALSPASGRPSVDLMLNWYWKNIWNISIFIHTLVEFYKADSIIE